MSLSMTYYLSAMPASNAYTHTRAAKAEKARFLMQILMQMKRHLELGFGLGLG